MRTRIEQSPQNLDKQLDKNLHLEFLLHFWKQQEELVMMFTSTQEAHLMKKTQYYPHSTCNKCVRVNMHHFIFRATCARRSMERRIRRATSPSSMPHCDMSSFHVTPAAHASTKPANCVSTSIGIWNIQTQNVSHIMKLKHTAGSSQSKVYIC